MRFGQSAGSRNVLFGTRQYVSRILQDSKTSKARSPKLLVLWRFATWRVVFRNVTGACSCYARPVSCSRAFRWRTAVPGVLFLHAGFRFPDLFACQALQVNASALALEFWCRRKNAGQETPDKKSETNNHRQK